MQDADVYYMMTLEDFDDLSLAFESSHYYGTLPTQPTYEPSMDDEPF